MRPAALALCSLLALGCAPRPRFWSRREPTTPPVLRPVTAEAVIAPPAATDPDGAFASADGRSRSRQGPCDRDAGADAHDDALTACTHTPETGWREWHFPGPGVLLDVFDGVALVARPSPQGEVDVVRYQIDLGRTERLVLPEPTARWARAGFTASGNIVGLARTGTDARPIASWVRGTADGPLTMTALPLDADDLGGTDRAAVCVGPSGAAVVSALGGSRRVDLPPGPRPAPAPRNGVGRAGERVVCAMGQCVIDGTARVPLDAPGEGRDPAAADIR